MPRILPSLVRLARRINPLLSSLLPVCRDLRSAQNELRWLGEHVAKTADRRLEKYVLRRYVARRAKGEPLQYILGTEYFGDLEIKCRPGVLIPRQETAAAVSHLVSLLSRTWVSKVKEREAEAKTWSPETAVQMAQHEHQYGIPGIPRHLTVVDLCTGTGCIPLLFAHDLYCHPSLSSKLKPTFIGADISTRALELADENLKLVAKSHSAVFQECVPHPLDCTHFIEADVLADTFPAALRGHVETEEGEFKCDILISNPPYISSEGYRKTTTRSVRKYEPKLALVPRTARGEKNDGDAFYPHLLAEAKQLRAKIFLFEVADLEQAKQVVHLALRECIWDEVEIWRDDPAASPDRVEVVNIERKDIKVRGEGHGRSVVGHRDAGTLWLG